MISPEFFLNAPLTFKKGIEIYPPTVNDIVKTKAFSQYRSVLLLSQEEIEDEFINKTDEKGQPVPIPTPLEYLMSMCYYNRAFERQIKKVFQVFLHQTITFIYGDKKILIGDLEELIKVIKSTDELVFITEEEYFNFQNKLRESLGEKPIEPPDPDEDPRVKRIKAKARYRDKIKAKKGMGLDLGTSLATICCMNLGITPLNVGELSYVAFKSLIDYYQEKEKYKLDIDMILAGGNSKKKKIKPKYWIRKLD